MRLRQLIMLLAKDPSQIRESVANTLGMQKARIIARFRDRVSRELRTYLLEYRSFAGAHDLERAYRSLCRQHPGIEKFMSYEDYRMYIRG